MYSKTTAEEGNGALSLILAPINYRTNNTAQTWTALLHKLSNLSWEVLAPPSAVSMAWIQLMYTVNSLDYIISMYGDLFYSRSTSRAIFLRTG
jgi:hypothetical protein